MLEPLGPLLAQHAFTAAVLFAAALMDIAYREVDPIYWYIAGKAGLILSMAESLAMGLDPSIYLISLVASFVPAVAALILYYYCLLGGSDVAALAFIAVSSPLPVPGAPPIPPSAAGILAGGLYALVYYAAKLAAACGLTCLTRGKAVVTSRQLAFNPFYRWWLPRVEGGSCSIEASPPEVAALRGGSVEASPGIPLVAAIALGYATYLASSTLLYTL